MFIKDYPGRESRQQLEENFRMQHICAKLMSQFIGINFSLISILKEKSIFLLDRIRKSLWSTRIANDEEVTIQLTGLEQVYSDNI